MPLNKYDKEEFFFSLESNEKLQKIVKSIYYTTGHNVDMINTSSTITLELLLEYIDQELHLVDEPKKIVKISIENGLDEFFSQLEKYYKKEDESLFIFDFLSLDDVLKAEYLFMMINKERNRILEGLNAPILLVMTKEFKTTFSYAASDFWSVNKLSVHIEYVAKKEDDSREKKESNWEKIISFIKNFFSDKKENISPIIDNKLEILKTSLNEVEQELKLHRDDKKLERLYLIRLIEVAEYFEKYHGLEEAYKFYDKALQVAQNLVHKQSDSIEAKRDLSVSLDNIAKIYLQKGDADKALKHYQESLALAQSIENKRPDSIEAKRDLSVSYYKIAMVYKEEKKFDLAREQLLKARALILPFKEYAYGDFENMLEIFEKDIEEMR